MTLLFKITGFIFVILTTSLIGFSKANALNMRHKRLTDITKGLSSLKEGIRLHGGDCDRLLRLSFAEFPISYAYLKPCDTELLDEFFTNFGSTDSKSEYERCELYTNLLNQNSQEAKTAFQELNRLYKSIGVLSGVLICIFFI